MELIIETLTGTAFELRVSPFETVMSVKAKIQRLEGIPITQQHLIFRSTELQDDFCLHDYSIYDGATLKLVLAMRGGPINTRRVPMEDSTLREMAEYVEANRDEIWEKLPGNRQVTILVFREGDQLNFFRFVDRGDGSLTPLSESLSGTSMFNLNDEYDEEEAKAEAAYLEREDEHERLKEKMQTLKAQMEKLSLEKPPTKRPSSGRQSAQSRLQPRPISNVKTHHTSLSKAPCLPPVGQSLQRNLSKVDDRVSSSEAEELNFNSSDGEMSPTDPRLILTKRTSNIVASPEPIACGRIKTPDPLACSKSMVSPSSFLEGGAHYIERTIPDFTPEDSMITTDSLMNHSGKIRRPVTSMLHRELAPLRDSTVKKKELTLDSIKDILRPPSTATNLYKHDGNSFVDNASKETSKPLKHDYTLQSIKDALARSSSKYDARERMKESAMDSLTTNEARVMSGLLRQASIEKLGKSRLEPYLPSTTSKSRLGSYTGTGLRANRRQTPEAVLASSLLRMSAHRDTRLSPTYRLPPVKAKKKTSKRCLFCTKKTGLATSYMCRCGNNFCASHRYAESHNCSYDYKTEGRKLLEQNNPVVAAPKLPKI